MEIFIQKIKDPNSAQMIEFLPQVLLLFFTEHYKIRAKYDLAEIEEGLHEHFGDFSS